MHKDYLYHDKISDIDFIVTIYMEREFKVSSFTCLANERKGRG